MRGSLRALRRVDALVSAATMDADTTHAPDWYNVDDYHRTVA
ncbi:MAG: hypothetical protein ACR2IR_12715 [Acidimicrobiia bacterium]